MSHRKPFSSYAGIFFSVLLLGVVLVCLVIVYSNLFPKNDYAKFFHPSTLLFIQGQNPYTVNGLFNPPWLYMALSPLLLLPVSLGAAVLTLLNLIAVSWVLYRNRSSKWVLFFALLSPVTLSMVMTSNVDGLLLLGVLLPPQWGLFVVLTKPQFGMGIAIYWAWEAFRSGGLRQLMKVFAPVIVAFLTSFAIYGFYLFQGRSVVSSGWNVNRYLFPYLLVPALLLLFFSIYRKQISLSYGVGPLASPYASPNSYIGLIPAFAWNWKFALAVWIIEWVWFLSQFQI